MLNNGMCMQWRLENKTLIVIICLKFVYRVFYFFNLRSGGYKGRGGDVFFHFLNCCEIYVCPHYRFCIIFICSHNCIFTSFLHLCYSHLNEMKQSANYNTFTSNRWSCLFSLLKVRLESLRDKRKKGGNVKRKSVLSNENTRRGFKSHL